MFEIQNRDVLKLTKSLISLSSTLGLILWLEYRQNPEKFELKETLLLKILGILGLSSLLENQSKDFVNSISDLIRPKIFIPEDELKLKELQKLALDNWENIPKDAQKEIERLLSKFSHNSSSLTKKLNDYNDFRGPDHNIEIEKKIRSIIYIMTAKNKLIDIIKVKKDINGVLEKFSPEFIEQAYNFLKQACMHLNNNNSKLFPITYLQGAPGVGKTFFCKQIAKLLNLPLFEIHSSQINEAMLANGSSDKMYIISKALIHAAKTKNTKSVILYIKNIDIRNNNIKRMKMTDFYYRLCFKETIYETDNFLKLKNIDISKVIIIFSGNKKELDINECITNKVITLRFPEMTTKLKTDILTNHLHEKFKKNNFSISKDSTQILKDIINTNQEPGVGISMKKIDKYIDYLNNKNLLEQWGDEESYSFILNQSIESELKELQGLVYRNKAIRPKNIQEELENLFEEYLLLYYEGKPEDADAKKRKSIIITDLSSICYLPKQILKDDVATKITTLISSYPKELQSQILEYSQSLIYMVNNPDKNKRSLYPIYLLGSPGVGKTYFMENIAEILKIPLYKVMATKLNKYDLGMGTQSIDPSLKEQQYDLLTKALVYAGKKQHPYVILFIDEVDKVLNNDDQSTIKKYLEGWLLEKLESSDLRFFSSVFWTELSKLKIFIVLAGNKHFPKKCDALKSRVITFQFPDMDVECKTKLARASAVAAFNSQGFNMDDATKKEIDEIISKDPNPGFRKLDGIINEFARFKAKELYFSDWGFEATKFNSNAIINVDDTPIDKVCPEI